MKSINFKTVFIMSLLAIPAVVGTGGKALAQEHTPAAIDGALAECLKACAAKADAHMCVVLGDFKDCLKTVDQCKSVSDVFRDAAGAFCKACGEGPAACRAAATSTPVGKAKAPPSKPTETRPPSAKPEPTPSKTDPPPAAKPASAPSKTETAPVPKTDRDKCKSVGGVWETGLAEREGLPPDVDEHCHTLSKTVRRVDELERKLREQSAGTGKLSAEQLDLLAKLERMDLPSDLIRRLHELESGMRAACAPITDKPDASLAERCDALRSRLDKLESGVKDANVVANRAEVKADKAVDELGKQSVRIAKLEAAPHPAPVIVSAPATAQPSVAPLERPSQYPAVFWSLFRASGAASAHVYRTPGDNSLLALAGGEVQWMPKLTRKVSLHLLGGGGRSTGEVRGSPSAVLWFGAGLGWQVEKDFVAEALLVHERYLREDEVSKANFNGLGPGIIWLPGLNKRQTHDIVPSVGARALIGFAHYSDTNGNLMNLLDAVFTVHAGIGF